MTTEQKIFLEILDKSGLNQTEFASLTGTSKAHISYLKNGKMEPKISTLERFCKEVGLSMKICILDADEDQIKY